MQFPTEIIGHAIKLRGITAKDVQDLFGGWTSQPDISKYLQFRLHSSIDETENFAAAAVEQMRCGSKAYYTINTLTMNGDVAGIFSIEAEDDVRLKVGFITFRRFQRRGFALSALKLALEWGFSVPAIHRIYALSDTENTGSIRTLERAGLTREGTLKSFGVHPNISPSPRDVFIYASVRTR